MFFSRCVMVVFKTTGGRSWNPPSGLRPLSPAQRRNRTKNLALTMKNMSILKLAEANQPEVPVRLYKPLNFSRMQWMKKKLEETRAALGWDMEARALQEQARALRVGGGRQGAAGSLLPPAARAALQGSVGDK
ncbi:hypothetical protein CHLRE_16g684950v5 [Chlamydomonas reinhardtii]|uniref:Uncharacterized protein n=1 Tax=Chlamydomonas reinhardtii TaxID=3055 RepID=A8IS96_CHLRE|nr:uncharacterized protein CHLRE_16g684950v5 [Chlamydomonas reinhardtii]PNW72039.1 hypothetical protein CHLRE_16g684950v5 [Chlamydomonas reinhardtii]7PKT_I Chain I, mL63/57/60 [Chlamydomonas reinhardtii]|eukprot:XP_001691929.1 hypothetical protein CHLREDRAFT_189308 [Chlamydomonas reinhardtii]